MRSNFSESRNSLVHTSKLVRIFAICFIVFELLLINSNFNVIYSRIFPLVAVSLISVVAADLDIAKLTILLTFSNGIIRRLLAGNDSHYVESDILILLPLIPLIVYIFRRLDRLREVPPIWVFFLVSITLLSIPRIPIAGISVLWGICNTPVLILSVLLGLYRYHMESLLFIKKLANFSLFYLAFQAVNLPSYDFQWCMNRRSEFVQLMSCEFPNTRLWGTMESPAAMGCFLAIPLTITIFDLFRGTKGNLLKLQAFAYLVGLIATGTRTFLVAIPVALIVSMFATHHFTLAKVVKYLFGLLVFTFFTPLLAQSLGLSGFWVERLVIGNTSGDVSFNARSQQTIDWILETNPADYIIGGGIGSFSRGTGSIDSGFFALLFEIGLPLTFLFYYLIIKSVLRSGIAMNQMEMSVCVFALFIFANFSFPFITGSTSVLFWLLLNLRQHDKSLNEILEFRDKQ